MNTGIINQFKINCDLFQQQIKDEIKSKNISNNNIECFLFNCSWEKLLNDSNGDIYKKYPEFKSEFSHAIQSLENNDILKLQRKSYFEIIYSKALKIYNVVKYYAGYNKLIIEYKGEKEHVYNIILFINPLEQIKNKVFIAFQIKDNNKMELYKAILQENINNKYINNYLVNNNIIIIPSFKEVINKENIQNLFNDINNYNEKTNIKNNLLKLFIFVFYFNKLLSNIDGKLFNEYKRYFLINPDWFNKFKGYYDYKAIYDILDKYDKNNSHINYNNLESDYKIRDIIIEINQKLNLKNLEKLKDINIPIFINDIELNKNFFIFPDKIINIIQKLYDYKPEEIIRKPKIFSYENEKTFLFNNLNIIFVSMKKEDFLFIPKYIFSYKSDIYMNKEKNDLFSCSNIIEYIKSRGCNENNFNTQQLINKNKEKVGDLINLSIHPEKEIKELKEKNLQLKEELDNEKKNSNKINEQNKSLKKNEDKYKNKIKEYENQIKESEDKIKEYENQKKESEAQYKNKIKNYENQKKEIEDKIKIYENQKKESEAQYKNKIKDFENQKKEIEDKIKVYENQIKESEDKYKNKIKEYENRKKESEDNYRNKMIEYENQKKESEDINKREEEINKKSKEISEKEKEVNNKIAFLEDKENLIEEESKKMEEKKQQFNKELIDLKKEIESNKKILSDIKNNIKDSSPALVGLNNIGATCFMNSTLQCLSQTKVLSEFFLNEKNRERIINNNLVLEKISDTQLCPAFLELIKNLWDKNGPKSFSPHNFMNTVEKMNPLFKKGQAGDSKDFIIFILEQLHKELKKPSNYKDINPNQPLNQYDKNNAFNYFFNDFKKECSVVSDLFFGFTETTNECLFCKNIYNSQGRNNPICYNYGIFNCLIFPLEEVKNMKNNYCQNFQNNIVTIYDCFIYNQKTDVFTGDNRNYCNICKQLWDSNYCSRIFVSPNVLILILNRGRDNIYNVKLDFSEKIDITPYALQKDKLQLNYDLYGVISHIGESGPNAHFVASCKSPIDNKWYRFNDALVNPITNLQKEVIDFGTPYILFYQKL